MKYKSLLLVALLCSGITLSMPVQVYADAGSNIRTTGELNQISRNITILVNQGQEYGSGFIIGRHNSSYYVLTASHVVSSNSSIQITAPDQRVYQASVLTRNLPNLDLAILEFQSNQAYQVATLANYRLSDATSTIAGGNIYISGWNRKKGGNQSFFTCGTVIPDSLGFLLRQDPISDGYELAYTNITQAGLSGGPILDNQGRVVGIHGRAEGEELEAIGSLTLGLSLGIPSWRFLQVIRNSSIQLPLIIDDTLPENLHIESSSGLNPCRNDISSPNISSSALDWANYANSMLRVGRLVDALFAYNEAIKKNINGELYQIWYGRGLALILLNRPNEALRNFERALQLWDQLPTSSNLNRRLNVAKTLILRYQGMILAGNERYQEALAIYDEGLAIDPSNDHLWLLRAGILSSLNRDQEAINAYSEAIRIQPRAELFAARSNFYFNSRQYDLALEDLDAALQLSPYNAQIYAMRGAIRKKLGDVQEGKHDYEQVYELTSQLAQFSELGFDYANFLIAQAELFVGNIDTGVNNVVQAIEGIGNRHTNMIMTELLQEMFNQRDDLQDPESSADFMVSYLERLRQTYGNKDEVENNIDESTIHLVRAMFLMRVNTSNLVQVSNTDIESAYHEVEQAIQLDHGSENIYLAYAMRSAFRANDGNEQGADEDFRKALEKASSSVEAYLTRGIIHLTLGNLQESLADLQIGAQLAYEQSDLEMYQEIMSLIDRVQNLSH